MRRRLSAPRGEIVLPVGEDEPFIPKGTKTLFAYLAHAGEIDAADLIDDAIARGITVAAPAVVSEGHLEFRAIGGSHGPFKTGAYGIREPVETASKLWPATLRDEAFPVAILVPAPRLLPRGRPARARRGLLRPVPHPIPRGKRG